MGATVYSCRSTPSKVLKRFFASGSVTGSLLHYSNLSELMICRSAHSTALTNLTTRQSTLLFIGKTSAWVPIATWLWQERHTDLQSKILFRVRRHGFSSLQSLRVLISWYASPLLEIQSTSPLSFTCWPLAFFRSKMLRTCIRDRILRSEGVQAFRRTTSTPCLKRSLGILPGYFSRPGIMTHESYSKTARSTPSRSACPLRFRIFD